MRAAETWLNYVKKYFDRRAYIWCLLIKFIINKKVNPLCDYLNETWEHDCRKEPKKLQEEGTKEEDVSTE